MSYEFKVGDLVKCVSNNFYDKQYKNKIGKIIKIDKQNYAYPYCVKFFNIIKWRNRRFLKREIESYQPILKLFLREKNPN